MVGSNQMSVNHKHQIEHKDYEDVEVEAIQIRLHVASRLLVNYLSEENNFIFLSLTELLGTSELKPTSEALDQVDDIT